MSVSNREVAAVQRDYPKIYLACHTRHVRRRSGARITPQESTLLAHLSATRGIRASELARHLGIGAPSVSATLKRLVEAGLVTRRSDTVDRRAATLWLSQAGAKVMQASSVLDARRVALMLGRIGAADRRRAAARAGAACQRRAASAKGGRVKRVAVIVLVVLMALVAAVWGVGALLPVAHVASGTRTFDRSTQDVYRLVSSVEDYPRWWEEVRRVEVLQRDGAGRVTFRQHAADGPMTMQVVEQQPPARFVTRIADPDQPFGGTWTFEVSAEGTRTRLTITERGEVHDPLFRFLSRFVFGHTATIESFLNAAASAL